MDATKPLTPSHVKMFVWFDVLVKATRRVTDLTALPNRVTCDVTVQNLGFWHYLDTRHPAEPEFYADRDELWVAGEYVRFHAEGFEAPPAELEALRRRVEEEFYVHPASRRMLDIWDAQCEVLGVDRAPFHTWRPLPLSGEAALEELASLDLLLDARPMGGGAYLDLTPDGLPLRQVINEHGVPNYLLHVLRELLGVAPEYDRVLLALDAEVLPDFDLVARVLRRRGIDAATFPVARVNLPGVSGTSRTGGWEEFTLGRLIERLVPRYGVPAFRLGVRMYYVLHVGLRGSCPFEPELLERFVRRAAGAVEQLDGAAPAEAPDGLLRELWEENARRERAFVEPNRLVQTLLKRARGDDDGARALVRELLL